MIPPSTLAVGSVVFNQNTREPFQLQPEMSILAPLHQSSGFEPLFLDDWSKREHGKYKRFVPVAEAFAAMSKMPGTKVGCLILGQGYQVLSSGWNGAARGCDADVDGRLADRDTRLAWVVHAEANAIANAARSGTALIGSTAIVTLMPCMSCAKSMVQAGVIRVLCPTPTPDMERWASEFDLTRQLFAECGVELVHYDTIGEKE